MHYVKRISVFVVIFISLFFLSCKTEPAAPGKDDGFTEDISASLFGEEITDQPSAERLYPNLPDVNYNGEAFTFLVFEWNSDGYWGSYEIDADEETGDVINDAVYRRNRAAEEKLNIDIKEVRTADVNGFAQKSVTSGDSLYDCVMPRLSGSANMAGNGYLLSYDQLPHIDLKQPWWDQNAASMLTIGGQLFFTVGDLTVMDKDSMFIVMFNKTVAKNGGIEDLYGLVRENKWTMEKFHSVIKEVSRDLDGDGSMGFDDLAGLVSSDFAINVMYYNSGETVTRKNAEDYPYFTMNGERGSLAAEKAFEIVTDKSAAVLANELKGIANPWTDGINKMFHEDRGLFLLAQITFIHRTRTMESDFGVLPSPKLDETQDKYYSSINPGVSSSIAVPVTVKDREKTSAVLEALSAESRYTLIPAYYDITITNKMMRDEESAEMLDIILSSRVFDLGFIYNWGDLGNVPLSLYPRGGSFISTYEKREPKAVSEMEKTIEMFKNLKAS